jgi:PAS domain S-box-containing protein
MPDPTPPLPITADDIVDTVREPLLVLNADLRVRRANRSFYRTFHVAPGDTEGRLVYELGDRQWDIPALRRLLEEVLPQNTAFDDFEVAHDFESIGRKVMLLNARRVYRESNRTESILLAIEDITERRRVEDALAAQQEWQRVTLRSIGDAVITTDVESRVTYLNPVAEALTGWTAAEAVGKPLETVFQIVNEETHHPAENPVTKSLRDGHVVGLANRTILIRKDGGEWSIDDSAAPIRAASGETIGVVLTFRDISERRKLERAAQAAQEYAENIVETVREAMLVLDGDLRVKSANGSFYRTFGVTPAETENRLLYDLGNRQWDILALRTLLEEILPRQTSFNDFEVAHDFESIGPKVMLLNARRVQGDHADTGLILLAIEDITERRRLEDERRELETRFTALVKNIRDHSVFTLDPQGRITSWNREAERILGHSEAEALGQHFSIIFTAEDIEAGVPAHELKTAMSEGRAEDERWHLRKSGERFWALGIVSPTHDASGRHTGFSKILRDMTDRKRAQDTLRQQAEALREADRRKDEFLAMLAHELRNPLAPIRNALHVVQVRGRERRQAVRQAWEMIERQVECLARLVDDLLDVSRISRGKINLQKGPVDVALLVARAVEGSRPLIEARRHDLKVALPDEPMWVEADPTRMAQVLWNLLNNAAKYTPEGGRIRLTAAKEGGEAVIRVRDTGMGIPPKLLPRMFDLFTQAERTLDRAEGGLGIGLTLVRRLTEMHNGVVQAFSAGPGEGSEFVVRLPLLPDTPPAASAAHEPEGGRRAKAAVTHRILVVDDNRDSADSLAMLLRLVGHDVRTVHDGRQALVVAATYRPDLVLLDIGLPGMDGFAVARHLRSQPELAGVVLVALTGYGSDEDRRQAQAAGFNHHMVKPVNFDALNELLTALEPHQK